MYNYTFTSGNPEGMDFVLNLQHENLFSQKEFQEIIEDAIIDAFDKEIEEIGYAFRGQPNEEKIFENLKKQGFQVPSIEVYYSYEPYWGEEHMGTKLRNKLQEIEKINENRKLLRHIEREKKNEKT
jgi:hypothetical protein